MKIYIKITALLLSVLFVSAPLFSCANNPPAPVTEPVTEPITYPVTEPATEPVTDSVTDPITEPITEPITGPITEPITEPVTEPATDPAIEVDPASQSNVMAAFSASDVSLLSEMPEAATISDFTGNIRVDVNPTNAFYLNYTYLKDRDAFVGIRFALTYTPIEAVWLSPEPTYIPFEIYSASKSNDIIIEYSCASNGALCFDVLNVRDGIFSCYRYPNENGNEYLRFLGFVKKSQGADKNGINEVFINYPVFETVKFCRATFYGSSVYPIELRDFPGCPSQIQVYTAKIDRYVNADTGNIIEGEIPYKALTVKYTQNGLLDYSTQVPKALYARIDCYSFAPLHISVPLTNGVFDSTVFYAPNRVASTDAQTILALATELLEDAENITEIEASQSSQYSALSFTRKVKSMYDVEYTQNVTISLIPLDANHFALRVEYSYNNIQGPEGEQNYTLSSWDVLARTYSE